MAQKYFGNYFKEFECKYVIFSLDVLENLAQVIKFV